MDKPEDLLHEGSSSHQSRRQAQPYPTQAKKMDYLGLSFAEFTHLHQKRAFHRTVALIRAIGKPCLTSPQAKRLDSLGLDYEELCRLHRDCADKEVFLEGLKGRGVRSKPVREVVEVAQVVVSCSRHPAVVSPGSHELQPPSILSVYYFFLDRLFSEPPHIQKISLFTF